MPQFPTFEVPALWAAREQGVWDSSECTGWGDTPAPLHFSPLPSYSWSSTECHQEWDFLSQGNHKCIIKQQPRRQESDRGCWPDMVLLLTASPAERTPTAVMNEEGLEQNFLLLKLFLPKLRLQVLQYWKFIPVLCGKKPHILLQRRFPLPLWRFLLSLWNAVADSW